MSEYGWCYIAGPMTGRPGFNYKAFDEARDELESEGWTVISPADLDRKNLAIDFSVMEGTEDLSHLRHKFARQDIDALLKVDRVYLLDGWQKSTGAMNEARIATMLGVPCFEHATRGQVDIDAPFAAAGAPTGEVRVVNATTGGEKGSKLARFDLIPVAALTALAEHYGKGAQKYTDRNWERGYDWSLSYAALQRHANLWWNGEDIDVETGSSHITAVAWHAFALYEFMMRHDQLDNRPSSRFDDEDAA